MKYFLLLLFISLYYFIPSYNFLFKLFNNMAHTIPLHIVRNTLDYGFVSRGKEIIKINKIDKNDDRYNILGCIPKIKCVPNVDYWLYLPIPNTNRQYYIQYTCNYRKSYFYSSLLDYDVNKEDYDEDFEEGEPYEDIMYTYSISRNCV